MKLPPRWVRRIVFWPLPLLIFFLYVTTVPLLLIAALILSYRLPGKWRALRLLGLATCYLFVEVVVTVFVSAHYRLLRWALRLLVYTGSRLFSLNIEQDGMALPTDSGDGTSSDAPLIVLSRHAGPADSFLLLHEVMSWEGRRPRIVAKAALQLDPVFDILLNRLPNRFIMQNPTPGSDTTSSIAELASGMTNQGAFVIFPEGGNFTEGRRTRAIERLRSDGHEEAARRAESMTHVLAPRPAGTLAAIDACPAADVVFVAHTGLDQISTVSDLWASLPVDKTLHLAWRVVPASEIPTDSAERMDWLFRAWERIDRWIDEQRERE